MMNELQILLPEEEGEGKITARKVDPNQEERNIVVRKKELSSLNSANDFLELFDEQSKVLKLTYFFNHLVSPSNRGKGFFDILYDDGGFELNVTRQRIKLNKTVVSLANGFSLSIDTRLVTDNNHNPSGTDHDNNSQPSTRRSFVVSPKKMKMLERAKSFHKQRSMRLRSLLATKYQPMPLQGIALLKYDPLQFTHYYQRPETTNTLPPLQIDLNQKGDDDSHTLDTPTSLASHTEFFPNMQFLQEIKSQTEQPTVQIDPSWQLVYVGNDNFYACSHLISQEILESELGIQAAVMFAVQIHGVDFPRYERSRLSYPAIYCTKTNYKPEAKKKPTPQVTKTTPPNTEENNEDGGGGGFGISKTKKEVITAVVNANQIIQIEKRGYYTYGEGVGEHYD
jgi:hypothetical protein